MPPLLLELELKVMKKLLLMMTPTLVDHQRRRKRRRGRPTVICRSPKVQGRMRILTRNPQSGEERATKVVQWRRQHLQRRRALRLRLCQLSYKFVSSGG